MFRKINKQCIITGIFILCFMAYGCTSNPKSTKLNTPNLVSPDNSSLITDNIPMFEWTESLGALEYIIEVDNNMDFLSTQINTTINISEYTPNIGLPAERHWWRVRARDGDGNISEWSHPWEFIIIDPINPNDNCPNAPVDMEYFKGDKEITFRINDLVLGATGFNIYMDTNTRLSKTFYAEKKSTSTTTMKMFG